MRIRVQLLVAVATSVALGLGAVLAVLGTAHDEDRARQTQSRAQMTSHGVSSLLILTQEYARHSEARAGQQWHQRQASIAAALASEDVPTSTDPALVELRGVTRALPPMFERLEEIADRDDAFSLRRKEVLLDQLLTSTQAMSDYAYQWYDDAALRRRTAEERFQAFAMATPLVMLAMLVALAALVRRRVLRPLMKLDEATAALTRGDLSARIASVASDELGDLSRRFDLMSEALARSTEQLHRSERQQRLIADNLPTLMAYIDGDERFVFANAHFSRVMGLDATGRTLSEVLGAEVYAVSQPHAVAALAGERRNFERVVQTAGGTIYQQVAYVPDHAEDGAVAGFFAMAFDVTNLREAQLTHARDEARLRMITDNLPVLISYIDADQRLRFANDTYRTWFGIDPQALIGQPMLDVVGKELYEPIRAHVGRALGGERVEFEDESVVRGVARTSHTCYVPDVDGAGVVQGIYALSSDVSALKSVERQLQTLARFDTLTGLPNRLQYNEKLPEALLRARRKGEAVALMFLDIDHFKSINDSLGHAAGDAVLTEFAARLSRSVRATDTVVRLAGDEFVVILEGLHSDAEPQFVARKIIAQVSRPIEIDGRPLDVTTSVGIAYHDLSSPPTTASELLAEADAALYQAKRAGRNTYRLASCEATNQTDR